jgi:hypothetical protein
VAAFESDETIHRLLSAAEPQPNSDDHGSGFAAGFEATAMPIRKLFKKNKKLSVCFVD